VAGIVMRLLFIFILYLPYTFFAAELEFSSFPEKTCGTPIISKFDSKNYLENLKSKDPQTYIKLLNQMEQMDRFNREANDVRQFYGFNFTTESHYPLTATLKRTGIFTRIWVENESLDKNYVTDQILDELLNNLENISGANSIDSNRGIIEIDTLLFGQPPNYDGDGIVDFLILDIKDNFDSTTASNSFIAGYFSSGDQTNSTFSNKMDLMYLDAYPGIYFNSNYRTEQVLATTAHEFQHLIHYHYDKDENDWVNEGLSELGATYCGYGLQSPGLFLENTNVSLPVWGGEVRDYARVNLWTLYCAEQLGLNFIKKLVQNPTNDVTGFNQVISQLGLNSTFETVFQNWVVANWLNNVELDPRYGYLWEEARYLTAKTHRTVYNYPQNNIAGNIIYYGCEYHQFRGQDSLNIVFSQQPSKVFWLEKGPDYQQATEIFGNQIVDPNFSENSNYVLALFSNSNHNYNYNADAKYSLKYFEIAHDDGEVDLNIKFTGIAANHFVVPESQLVLESIQFWGGSSPFVARIHFYQNTPQNYPGDNIISPLEVVVPSNNGWFYFVLPEPIGDLEKDEVIYIGVEINQPDKSLGYDSDNKSNVSFLKMSGQSWRKLSDFQINGSAVDGDWMIRTVFTGLTFSGTSGPNNQPLILSTPKRIAIIDSQYTYQVEATDPDGDILQYRLLNAPFWLNIENNTGLIYGTPTHNEMGKHSVSLIVEDDKGGTVYQNYQLTVLFNSYFLTQNYPNPFNNITTIEYNLLESGFVVLTIFNLLGEEVERLIEKEQSEGFYKISWSADFLPSGIYFYQLKTKNFTETKKLIRLE
jgi:hypothetical protein